GCAMLQACWPALCIVRQQQGMAAGMLQPPWPTCLVCGQDRGSCELTVPAQLTGSGLVLNTKAWPPWFVRLDGLQETVRRARYPRVAKEYQPAGFIIDSACRLLGGAASVSAKQAVVPGNVCKTNRG